MIRKDLKSFTLIELLVTIAIIGILSGIVIIAAIQARQSAKIGKARAEVRQFYHAITILENDTNEWPGHQTPGVIGTGVSGNEICPDGCSISIFDDGAGLLGSDGFYPNWHGPYLQLREAILDPWGNEYFFDTDYDIGHNDWAVVIGSYGPNGIGNNLYDDDDIIYIIVQ